MCLVAYFLPGLGPNNVTLGYACHSVEAYSPGIFPYLWAVLGLENLVRGQEGPKE